MFLIDPNDAAAGKRAERHARLCQEMIELGMELLRDTAQSMREERDPNPKTPDLATQFTNLSRCIRQTMLLENHVADARRNIVTKTIQLEKDRAFAATFNQQHAAQHANPTRERAERPERLQTERTHLPETEEEIPSLLACISQEIGIDLEDRALLASLPHPQPKPVETSQHTPEITSDPPPD